MSPESSEARGDDGPGAATADEAPRVRRPVEDPDGQGQTLGEAVLATAAALRGLSRDRLFLVAMLVVAVSLALKVYVLAHSYFVEDDYLFFAAAHATELVPGYLFDLHKGHFMPGALFLVYLQTAFWPYDWWVSSGIMLVLQAAALLVFLRLLWEMFGRRWVLLVPLTVYALAPLTIPVLGWWAAALNAVPFQLATALALLWTVRYLRTGTHRYAWLAGGAVVAGMLFSVKAMFLPSLMLVVAVAWLYPGSLWEALRNAFLRHRAFWVSMVVLTIGYLFLYLSRQSADEGAEGAGVPEWDAATELARRLLVEVFPVGALGGPFEWSPVTPAGGLVEPRGVVILGAWAALLAIVLVSLGLRRRSWRAWALLAGYLVFVDVIPTVIARGREHGMAGTDPRYVADAALVFALCLALAFLVTREERAREHVGNAGESWRSGSRDRRSRPGRALRGLAVLTVSVYALSAAYSTHAYAQTLSGERLQQYLANVRASLEEVPEGAGLYSRPVPEDIVLPWNGDRRLSSHVLPPLADTDVADRMAFPQQSNAAYVFDDEGHLVAARPSEHVNAFVPEEGEECLPTWDGIASWGVFELGGIEQVATVGYTSQEDTLMAVVIGDAMVDVELPAAPDGAYWHVPIQEPGDSLGLLLDDAQVCLSWASLGPMVPVSEDGEPDEEEWLQEGEEIPADQVPDEEDLPDAEEPEEFEEFEEFEDLEEFEEFDELEDFEDMPAD